MQLQDIIPLDTLPDPVSIIGFGSLLSEHSSKFTMPNLKNFRKAIIYDYRRVFAHIAPIFFERGIANRDTKEMSSLSTEYCPGEKIIVVVFEIPKNEIPQFYEREHEFRFLEVTYQNIDPANAEGKAIMCGRYSDEEYLEKRCGGSKAEFDRRYGRYSIDKIWRDDIFPCRLYLRHCVLAATKLGEDALESFLEHTYLGDRVTNVKKYLEKNPSIMLEEPPENLKARYNG